MWYLISVYWLWLLAAFFLGLLLGVLFCPCKSLEPRVGKTFWIIVLAVFLVVLTLVFYGIKGVAGHWYEMAVFFGVVGGVGLSVGCLMATTADTDEDENAPDLARAEPPLMAVASSAPTAEAAKGQPAAAPALANEADFAGIRPAGFVSARNDKADDLKLISGIGKQNEGRLHGLGIWHFDQIAAWTPDNVLWIGSYLAFPGRIEREQWVDQAKTLAAGGATDFAKRAASGKVASSRDDGDKGADNIETVAPAKSPRGKKPV